MKNFITMIKCSLRAVYNVLSKKPMHNILGVLSISFWISLICIFWITRLKENYSRELTEYMCYEYSFILYIFFLISFSIDVGINEIIVNEIKDFSSIGVPKSSEKTFFLVPILLNITNYIFPFLYYILLKKYGINDIFAIGFFGLLYLILKFAPYHLNQKFNNFGCYKINRYFWLTIISIPTIVYIYFTNLNNPNSELGILFCLFPTYWLLKIICVFANNEQITIFHYSLAIILITYLFTIYQIKFNNIVKICKINKIIITALLIVLFYTDYNNNMMNFSIYNAEIFFQREQSIGMGWNYIMHGVLRNPSETPNINYYNECLNSKYLDQLFYYYYKLLEKFEQHNALNPYKVLKFTLEPLLHTSETTLVNNLCCNLINNKFNNAAFFSKKFFKRFNDIYYCYYIWDAKNNYYNEVEFIEKFNKRNYFVFLISMDKKIIIWRCNGEQ